MPVHCNGNKQYLTYVVATGKNLYMLCDSVHVFNIIHRQYMYFLKNNDVSIAYTTTKVFVQSIIKPMLLELKSFHQNRSYKDRLLG